MSEIRTLQMVSVAGSPSLVEFDVPMGFAYAKLLSVSAVIQAGATVGNRTVRIEAWQVFGEGSYRNAFDPTLAASGLIYFTANSRFPSASRVTSDGQVYYMAPLGELIVRPDGGVQLAIGDAFAGDTIEQAYATVELHYPGEVINWT